MSYNTDSFMETPVRILHGNSNMNILPESIIFHSNCIYLFCFKQNSFGHFTKAKGKIVKTLVTFFNVFYFFVSRNYY